MSIFGDFDVQEALNIPIHDGYVMLKRISKEYVLLWINRRGNTYSKLLNLEPDKRLSIRPIPPRAGSLDVDCIYLKLENELVLKPGDKAKLCVHMPLDLGLYVDSILVDAFPLSKVKYALYGPPDLGELCRFVDLGKRENMSAVRAELELSFESRSESASRMRKVILPLNGLSVFRSEGETLKIQPVEVIVYSEFHVEVSTRSEVPDGFSLFSFIKPERYVYVMRYGS